MKFFFKTLLLVLLVGCGAMPLKPGRASFQTLTGISGDVVQSQNPKTETRQSYRRTVTEPVREIGRAAPLAPEQRVISEEITTVIGAAQKDVAREIGAKLSSLKGIVWIGVLVFLFGAASFVYPPLKLIVGGSITTSAVIALAGLALIVLPTLIVGNEILILGGSVGAALLYWFSNRHGKLQGLVDANRNGVDDRKETL